MEKHSNQIILKEAKLQKLIWALPDLNNLREQYLKDLHIINDRINIVDRTNKYWLSDKSLSFMHFVSSEH